MTIITLRTHFLKNIISGNCSHWSIDTVNSSTLLLFVVALSGIETCLLYLRSYYTNFPYHVKNENLTLISHNCHGASKICYVKLSCHRGRFERIAATKCFSPEFLNDREERLTQELAMRSTFFNQLFLQRQQPLVKVSKIEQREDQFVASAPGTYHVVFNTTCNVTKAKNFSDYFLIFFRLSVCRNEETDRSFGQ